MKTIRTFIFVLLISGLLSSCYKDTVRVSGEVVTEELNLTGYSELKVSDAFNVFVTFSDTEEKIAIEANDDIQEFIIVEKKNEKLIIRLKNYTNIKGNATLNVFITSKSLTAFDISGAAEVTLENELSMRHVAIELSGSSNFKGELLVNQLELRSTGASNADLYGTADRANVRLSGSSELRDFDLEIKTLDINMSGASDAYLSIAETIDVIAAGASNLTYKGNATIGTKRLSGSSQLIRKE